MYKFSTLQKFKNSDSHTTLKDWKLGINFGSNCRELSSIMLFTIHFEHPVHNPYALKNSE